MLLHELLLQLEDSEKLFSKLQFIHLSIVGFIHLSSRLLLTPRVDKFELIAE